MSGWPSLRARQHDGVDHAKRFRMRVTNAANALGKASEEMEQAAFEGNDEECRKLHQEAHALYEKFYDKWRRVCAAGKGK